MEHKISVVFPKYWKNIAGLEMLTYSYNFWPLSQININTTISCPAAFHQIVSLGTLGEDWIGHLKIKCINQKWLFEFSVI